MFFVAKRRAEKKEDKINVDGTILGLQVTNILLSMFGQDAVIKFRSLMSPRKLINSPYKDFRSAIQNNVSSKERVVTRQKGLKICS